MTASLNKVLNSNTAQQQYALLPHPTPVSFCIDQIAFRIQKVTQNALCPEMLRLIAEYVDAPAIFFSCSYVHPFALTEMTKVHLIYDLNKGQLELSWNEYQAIINALGKQKKDHFSEELTSALFTNFKNLMKEKNKTTEQLSLILTAHDLFLRHANEKTKILFKKIFRHVQKEIDNERVKEIQKSLEDMGLVSKTPKKPDCCIIT